MARVDAGRVAVSERLGNPLIAVEMTRFVILSTHTFSRVHLYTPCIRECAIDCRRFVVRQHLSPARRYVIRTAVFCLLIGPILYDLYSGRISFSYLGCRLKEYVGR